MFALVQCRQKQLVFHRKSDSSSVKSGPLNRESSLFPVELVRMRKQHLSLLAVCSLRYKDWETWWMGVGLKVLSLQRGFPPSYACSEAYLVLPMTFQRGINRTSFITRCDIVAVSKILVLLQLLLSLNKWVLGRNTRAVSCVVWGLGTRRS